VQGQLDTAQSSLRDTQASLASCRQERNHYEKESERWADDASRLTGELNKATAEVSRLKEWQDVIKKVEADKLREEQVCDPGLSGVGRRSHLMVSGHPELWA
jgi:chromosome segregation ATPase